MPAKPAVIQSDPLIFLKIQVCLEASDSCMGVKSVLSDLNRKGKNVELHRENEKLSNMNREVEADG